ncbi:MAG: DUF1844 domain-containing protein [Phycisphaerae bacterium]
MTEESGGGLHIDGDWKAEAAREKQRLAEQERREKQRGAAKPTDAPAFLELINLLAMHAAISLGGGQSATGEAVPANPMAAKHHIDLLDVLRQKTEGNLTDEEQRTLDAVLYELRQQYVQTVSAPPPAPKKTP